MSRTSLSKSLDRVGHGLLQIAVNVNFSFYFSGTALIKKRSSSNGGERGGE
jgi:hypothetical protein